MHKVNVIEKCIARRGRAASFEQNTINRVSAILYFSHFLFGIIYKIEEEILMDSSNVLPV